ncbi:hypothetical protein [Sinorhizobium sp. 22678]|uniref:hypothetical protein n=1 Tax=Sinorhizobium sp. 22678 TaxID=3453955 RepID=UPI003F852038
MADSEISRTLPAITPGKTDVDEGAIKNLPYQIDRRNLLPVTARLLSARIAEPAGKQRERSDACQRTVAPMVCVPSSLRPIRSSQKKACCGYAASSRRIADF